MKALPAPYHDWNARHDAYLAAVRELEAAALHGGERYEQAVWRHRIAFSHIGNEIQPEVSRTERRAA